MKKSPLMVDQPAFYPMIFSTEMVRALLDGRKTQTRRIVKDTLLQRYKDDDDVKSDFLKVTILDSAKLKIGAIIWVKETFSQKDGTIVYRSQVCSKLDLPDGCVWTPSLFMPKLFCRLFLKITDIRLERLKDISESDAIAEGIRMTVTTVKPYDTIYLRPDCPNFYCNAKQAFEGLWKSINDQESWDENPFVWVYDFKVVERPAEFLLGYELI